MLIQDCKNTHRESATLDKVGALAHLDPFLIRPSVVRRYLMVGSHAVVLTVIFLTSWSLLQSPLIFLSMNIVVGIVLCLNLCVLIKADEQLITVEFDGCWHINNGGETSDFDRIEQAVMWSWVVILYFKKQQRLSRRNVVVIFCDSLPPPQYKALRRWVLTYLNVEK